MNSFLNDINKAKEERFNQKQEVINEIVTYFYNEVNSPEFDEKLKERIIRDIKTDRVPWLQIRYWRYHDGCETTHFKMSYCKNFYGNGEYHNSSHNGVELWDIRYDVVKRLCEIYEDKLHSLGLKYSRTSEESRFDYPTYRYDLIV